MDKASTQLARQISKRRVFEKSIFQKQLLLKIIKRAVGFNGITLRQNKLYFFAMGFNILNIAKLYSVNSRNTADRNTFFPVEDIIIDLIDTMK